MFVVLEGVDGAGKTSLQHWLDLRLRELGQEVVCVKEPGATWMGEQLLTVRENYVNTGRPLEPWAVCSLYAADRAQTMRELIVPALEAGKVVIADRSIYSSVAYQGGGEQLAPTLVYWAHRGSMLVKPHLIILLRVDAETSLERATTPADGDLGYLERTIAAYDKQVSDNKTWWSDPWRVVDATLPEAEVRKRVWAELAKKFPAVVQSECKYEQQKGERSLFSSPY